VKVRILCEEKKTPMIISKPFLPVLVLHL
jgi:hypothetical protein